jgi:hypothetical protein
MIVGEWWASWKRPLLCLMTIGTCLLRGALSQPGSSQIRYCAYDTKPYITCPETGQPFGFGVTVASTIESTIQGDISFTCLASRQDVLDALKNCDCDVGIGGFTVETLAILKGTNVSLSYPYQPTAYAIIRRTEHTGGTIWGMFRPFTPGLWILVIFTPFMLAVFMTFFAWIISKYKKTSFSLSVLPQYSFQNTLSFLNDYTTVEYLDWDGNMPYMFGLKCLLQGMLVAFAFLCLIVTSVYTAQLTNIIISSTILSESLTFEEVVRSTEKLVIPNELSSYFETRFNSRYGQWVPNSTADFLDQVERVRSGEIDGLVAMVGPSLWTLETNNRDCTLTVNRNSYKLVTGHSFVYSTCVNQDFINQRDMIIRDVTQRGITELQTGSILGKYFVSNEPLKCAGKSSSINIHDLAGGWVILAGAVALPFLLSVTRYLYYLLIKCISAYGGVFSLNTPTASQPIEVGDLEANPVSQDHSHHSDMARTSQYGGRGHYSCDTPVRASRESRDGTPRAPVRFYTEPNTAPVRPSRESAYDSQGSTYGYQCAEQVSTLPGHEVLPRRSVDNRHSFDIHSTPFYNIALEHPTPRVTSDPPAAPRPSRDEPEHVRGARSEPASYDHTPTSGTSTDDILIARDDAGYVTS